MVVRDGAYTEAVALVKCCSRMCLGLRRRRFCSLSSALVDVPIFPGDMLWLI